MCHIIYPHVFLISSTTKYKPLGKEINVRSSREHEFMLLTINIITIFLMNRYWLYYIKLNGEQAFV